MLLAGPFVYLLIAMMQTEEPPPIMHKFVRVVSIVSTVSLVAITALVLYVFFLFLSAIL